MTMMTTLTMRMITQAVNVTLLATSRDNSALPEQVVQNRELFLKQRMKVARLSPSWTMFCRLLKIFADQRMESDGKGSSNRRRKTQQRGKKK
jgi:hypothetical protein